MQVNNNYYKLEVNFVFFHDIILPRGNDRDKPASKTVCEHASVVCAAR